MAHFSRSTTGKEVVTALTSQVVGRTIAITGPSAGGIGAETAISLANGHPKQLLLAGRSESKIRPVMQQVMRISPQTNVEFVELDLADQCSIRRAAAEIRSKVDRLDVLINNAAIMALPMMQKTKDGIEAQFGTNHLGHFLLTNLVMDRIMTAGKGARIVNVTSTAFELSEIRWDDWNFQDGQTYDPWKAYGQSKTANVLFTVGLMQRLKESGISAFAAHPGVMPTNLTRHANSESFAEAWKLSKEREKILGKPHEPDERKSLQQGCATTLVAALDPSIAERAPAFLRDCKIPEDPPPEYAVSEDNAEKLWRLSEELVGEHFFADS